MKSIPLINGEFRVIVRMDASLCANVPGWNVWCKHYRPRRNEILSWRNIVEAIASGAVRLREAFENNGFCPRRAVLGTAIATTRTLAAGPPLEVGWFR